MKFAFKQHIHNPNKPNDIPPEWVWIRELINASEQEAYEADNWIVLNSNNFQGYLDSISTQDHLRVLYIVHDQFKDFPPSKIDFRKHLRDDVYLQKNVTMLPNGRPNVATYSLDGVKIAEIQFVFEVNAFNFMTRRTEKLSYYKKNDEKSEQWIIADDSYDINNPYHLSEMMKERSGARALIIEEIKAFLNGVLAQFYVPQGKNYLEILEIAGDFWGTYSIDINSWINVGSPKFKNNLTTDTLYDFLDAHISESVTVKEYILSKLSY